MPEHAKKEPPYGSPIAWEKPKKPFQPLPPEPEGLDLVAKLETIAPKAAKQLASSNQLLFHAVGDTGGVNGTEVEDRIADAMQAQIEEAEKSARPGFFYLLGDVIYPVGAPEDYHDLFYKPFKHYDAPIVAIPGNHDGYGRPDVTGSSLDGWRMNFLGTLPVKNRFPYRDPMELPYVYWELSTAVVSIIGLYSNTEGFLDDPSSDSTPQQDWLAGRLDAAKRQGQSVIVTVHHPPYSLDDDHHGSPAIGAAIDAAAASPGCIPLVYYVFDLLSLEGKDLCNQPLSARRELLGNPLKKPLENIRFSDELRGSKDDLLRIARSLASRGWSPKDQIQSTKAAGAAAPRSNSRSPRPRNSLSAAVHCPKEAGAILVLCSSATKVRMGSCSPAESAPAFQKRSWQTSSASCRN
jgi:hypothetical protein